MSQMEDVFGFSNTGYNFDNTNSKYFSYSMDLMSPIDIKDYSYMFLVNNYRASETSANYDIEILHDYETHEIRIMSGDKEIYKNSMLDFGKQIYKKYGTKDKYDIDSNEMSFVDENENIKVKFIFNRIDWYEDKTENVIDVNSMEFYVLVNLK